MKNYKKLLIMLLLAFCCAGCGKQLAEEQKELQESIPQEEAEETIEQETEVPKEKETEKFEFPLLLDEERLALESVFSFTGMNPDCENLYGEDIATLQFKNISGKLLEKAVFTVTISNGDVFSFMAEKIPSGMEALVFDKENRGYDSLCRVELIQVEAQYSEDAAADPKVYAVDGSEITVTNNSLEIWENLKVNYHGMLEGMVYGGSVYELAVGNLEPGESGTVIDPYCLFGEIDVVNIVCE